MLLFLDLNLIEPTCLCTEFSGHDITSIYG